MEKTNHRVFDNLPKDPRRRRILERNRIAATKSRLRKRDEASALASRGQAMEAQNRYLSTCFDSLTSEIYNLKTQLLQHTDCNCVAIQQYIANEAKKTVVGLLSCSPAFQLENDSMSPDNGSSSGPSIADSLNMHSLEAGSFPPIWTNPVQRGHRASENLIPPSDSGYGSVLNSGKSTHILDVGCETRNLSRAALGAPVEKRENEAEVDDTLDAMDDCNTVYTDNMTISHVRLESYMTALVDDLFQKIGNLFQDPEVVEELAAALPRVLTAFSCKLGYAGSSQMHRDVMVFIHKYRGTMTEMFRERYADAMDARQNLNRRRDPPLMLSRWPASQDDSDYENLPEQSWETSPGNEFEEDHELSVPGLEEYKHMIYNAPSYEWVLGQLHREVLLSKPKTLGTLLPRMRQVTHPIMFEGLKEVPEAKRNQLYEAFELLEGFLTTSAWVAGCNVTLADLAVLAVITTIVSFGADISGFPKLSAWAEKCKSLPGYEENMEGVKAFTKLFKNFYDGKI